MDANTNSLLFLLLFVLFFVIDTLEAEDTVSGDGSELHASDRYAVAEQIN